MLRQANAKLRAQTERLRQEVATKHSELAKKRKLLKEREGRGVTQVFFEPNYSVTQVFCFF